MSFRSVAFQDELDFGLEGDQGVAWGYHFGHSFRRDNPDFRRLVAERVVFSTSAGDLVDRFRWLGGERPWDVPGWAMPEPMVRLVMSRTAAFAGREVLEVGTPRGRTAAIMASQGCRVTTIDHVDHGVRRNLSGLAVDVVVDDIAYARRTPRTLDLIVCDVHGNSPADWTRLGKPPAGLLRPGGTMLASNATLDEIDEWHEETGVRWFTSRLSSDWQVRIDRTAIPGLAIIRKPGSSIF